MSVRFPLQKISDAKKAELYGSVEGWGRACVAAVIGAVANGNDPVNNRVKKIHNYNVINGVINDDDYQHVTGYFGAESERKYPAKLQNFNIIKPVFEALKGEFINRPFYFDVFSQSQDFVLDQEKLKLEQFRDASMLSFLSRIEELLGGEIVDPTFKENVLQNANKEEGTDEVKKSDIEIAASHLAEYLVQEVDFRDKAIAGVDDFLATDSVIYKIESEEGYVRLRRIDPTGVSFISSAENRFLHDASMVAEERWLSLNEVWDYYSEYMSDEDREALETEISRVGNVPSVQSAFAFSAALGTEPINDPTGAITYNRNRFYRGDYFQVYEVEWKGFQPAYLYSEDGEMKTVLEKPKGVKSEEVWVSCVYQGVRIGSGIFCKIQRKDNVARRADNLNHVELSYTGILSSRISSVPISLVDLGLPYQELYNIMWMRLQHEIAGAAGKVILMDLAQLPVSKNVTLEDWLYHLKSNKVAFINSAETNDAGGTASFNQFRDVDLSISQSVQQYSSLLQLIRSEFERLVGVPEQRQGQVSQYETASGIEKSIRQSTAITESIYYNLGQVQKHVIRKLLYAGKEAYREGIAIQFISPDGDRKILRLTPEQLDFQDFGIFVEESGKTVANKVKLEQLASAAFQNSQATLSDMAKVVRSNSVAEIDRYLEGIMKRSEKMAQENAKAQQDALKEQQAYDMEVLRMELENKSGIARLKADTDIKIAEMEVKYQLKLERGRMQLNKENEGGDPYRDDIMGDRIDQSIDSLMK